MPAPGKAAASGDATRVEKAEPNSGPPEDRNKQEDAHLRWTILKALGTLLYAAVAIVAYIDHPGMKQFVAVVIFIVIAIAIKANTSRLPRLAHWGLSCVLVAATILLLRIPLSHYMPESSSWLIVIAAGLTLTFALGLKPGVQKPPVALLVVLWIAAVSWALPWSLHPYTPQCDAFSPGSATLSLHGSEAVAHGVARELAKGYLRHVCI